LAARISEKFGVDPELIEGSGGVFDVLADETLVFSKKREGRFPKPGEVEGAISALL
jgi:predicted Rdx family selenoprotein